MNSIIELHRTTLFKHLRKNLAGEVLFDEATRRIYGTDASIYQMQPLGVVVPRNREDLIATIQIAAETRTPVTPRGGGTSLSGQSIGPGIIIDTSKFLNAILDLDPTEKRVRVQTGVILDQLNQAAGVHHLQFGPEVSTSSRACLGGMIGNNSAGSRSIVYGKTIDHVNQLEVILADGRLSTFGSLSQNEWYPPSDSNHPNDFLIARTREIVLNNSSEIEARFPGILRRVSGYNLDVLCHFLTGKSPLSTGLHHLITGSEGTLAFTVEADLKLIDRPKFRGLLVPQFDSLAAAIDAVATCLELQPSAVEVMDELLLRLTRSNLALRSTMRHIPGSPAAVLMVEFSGANLRWISDRIELLEQRLKNGSGIIGFTRALDPNVRDPLWNLRKAAMPLLYSMPGDGKPITFVEDCAVAPERMPEFVAEFREILKQHGTDGAFYGHASVGCLHIRPVLNLKKEQDVQRMRRITDQVTDLLLRMGGSLSGEHGDGLARSEWNPKMFGSKVYNAFCEIKQLFDPQGIFNPGRVVHAPRMTENLRYQPDSKPRPIPTIYDYQSLGGILQAAEMCNGNGACRKQQGGAMCPSFRATGDEKDSPRGRANVLRVALSGQQPLRDLRSPETQDVFDRCLMCKACKAECPSNVDVAKLKADYLQTIYQNRTRPLGDYLVSHLPMLNRLGAPVAPLANWLGRNRFFRWGLEQLTGIDRRRSLPILHSWHFRRWFRWHRRNPRAGVRGRVILLADCFTTYNDPQIGKAAVRLLEQAGYKVELADLFCCGRTLISKGFLKSARQLVGFHSERLAQRVSDGIPILGLEPSCLLTLVDEWKDLCPGEATQKIARSARLADGWIAENCQSGHTALEFQPLAQDCYLHGHCHQQALQQLDQSLAALQLIPELNVKVLDSGCCGMAGSFGFEKKHFDLSVQIANSVLIPQIKSDPAALVAAPGTSCRHQMDDLAQKKALHPVEILFQQLRPIEN